jgi:hypothetical protein
MIVEIKMIFIGTTKFTPKNRSEPVFFGCVDRKRPVLGGPVRSPQYLGRSWTSCGPRLRVLGAKNRTEPDLKTLPKKVFSKSGYICLVVLKTIDIAKVSSKPILLHPSNPCRFLVGKLMGYMLKY